MLLWSNLGRYERHGGTIDRLKLRGLWGLINAGLGKLEEAARSVGREPAEAVMIGDGLLTDLAAARAIGARSVLMLTGVTSQAQLDMLPEVERPTEVASDAAGLAAALDRLGG